MQTFTQNFGDEYPPVEWKLELTGFELERIEKESGVLLTLMDEPVPDDIPTLLPKVVEGEPAILSQMLVSDPSLAARFAWILVESQASELGIDETLFRRNLRGSDMLNCKNAFLQELDDFFLQSDMTVQSKVLQGAIKAKEAMTDMADEAINQSLEAAKRTAREKIAAVNSGTESTNSPASPSATGGR